MTGEIEHKHDAGPAGFGSVPWSVAASATLHCLTGCAIGEVLGMIIGTALDWSDFATIALSIALAFLFGYSLTSGPLRRTSREAWSESTSGLGNCGCA